MRCVTTRWPLPWHTGQVLTYLSLLAPVPSHVLQIFLHLTVMSFMHPVYNSSKVRSMAACMLGVRSCCRERPPKPPPPKRSSNMDEASNPGPPHLPTSPRISLHLP